MSNQKKITKLHKAWEAGKKPMTDYSKEELEAIEDKLRAATVVMLTSNEFFAIMQFKLNRVVTDGIGTRFGHIKSACTDGMTVYYNPGFVDALSMREIVFLIAHELYHCIFEHMLNREDRDPKLWNQATDYVINGLLKRDRVGEMIEGGLYNTKYVGLDSFTVYDMLKEEQEQKQKQKGKGQGGGGAGDPDDNPDGEVMDDHPDVKEGDEGADGKPMSAADVKAISDNIKAAIIQAIEGARDGIGSVPGEIQRMIKNLLQPQIDWKTLVESTIASKQKYDVSFARPDRRSWSNPNGIIFPGDLPDTQINVAIAVDNSGSFTDELLQEALSEIAGIMENYNEYKVQLWCFDTRVSGYKTFTSEDMEDIRSYVFTGGGGTAIAVNWEYMKQQEIEADLFICFTDLESYDLNQIDPNFIDTVWVIHDNPNATPPFGRYAYYKPKGKK